jgi:hypothetical protein
MTLLNKSLMAALVGTAMGFAAPALAQSSPATNATVVADSSTSVVRADGSTVVTERVVTRRAVVPTACNFNTIRNVSDVPNVSGGIGGSIGGRMILGTTSALDVPLPGCGPIAR